MLPDGRLVEQGRGGGALSQCTYRCVVLPDPGSEIEQRIYLNLSQCTYRCVVLPDIDTQKTWARVNTVSMHLQVRGAP